MGRTEEFDRHARRAEMVDWAVRLGTVTDEALALRDREPVSCARARLAAAVREGTLRRSRPLHARPALYTATRVGVRASGRRGIAPAEVGAGRAEHAIWCALAAAALQLRYPEGHVMGEPELLAAERGRSRPLASVRVPGGPGRRGRSHRPDLVVWPGGPAPRGGGQPLAVEVELTAKAPQRLLCICRALARSRTLAGTLYLVAPAASGAVARALRDAGAAGRVEMAPLEAFIALAAAEGVPSAA